jgi:hypothetical protein
MAMSCAVTHESTLAKDDLAYNDNPLRRNPTVALHPLSDTIASGGQKTLDHQ